MSLNISNWRKNKLRREIMYFVASGLQYKRNSKPVYQYEVQISEQCLKLLKNHFNLNGLFKQSESLEKFLQLRKTNHFVENQSTEVDDLRFRLKGKKTVSINCPTEKFTTSAMLVIKFIRVN